MLSAIENPHIVGSHWFQWFDCFVTGRGDGANATCVSSARSIRPITHWPIACRDISAKLYSVRSGKK
jgi:hypothetical protein